MTDAKTEVHGSIRVRVIVVADGYATVQVGDAEPFTVPLKDVSAMSIEKWEQ